MNTRTQRETIKRLLKTNPSGINTSWVRDQFFIIDVPTRIFELKEEGLEIGKRRETNGTATYFLIKDAPQVILEPKLPQRYIYIKNTAIPISEAEYQALQKPEQTTIFHNTESRVRM